MSNRRAWYLDDPSEMAIFPITERPESNPHRIIETAIRIQSERKRNFNESLASQRIFDMVFRAYDTEDELAFFRELHETVVGDTTAFYLVLDPDASPREAVYGRKEKDYDPLYVSRTRLDGVKVRFWEYRMTFTEEALDELEIEE